MRHGKQMKTRLRQLSITTWMNLYLGLAFVLSSVCVVLLVNYVMRQQALKEAESKARLLLDRNLATHHYFTNQLKPSVFKLTDGYRPAEYFDPIWMSSTYAVREIDKEFKTMGDAGYYYKESAINARSPENEADEYERTFIQELNLDAQLVARSTIRTINGQPYFVVLRRGEIMEESCLQCHSEPEQAPAGLVSLYGSERSFHRKAGEAVSGISIRIPLAAAYAEARQYTLLLSVLLLVLLVGLFGTQYGFNRRLLVAPLEAVRDKALQITSDEKRLGEVVSMPVGRELSELATAFNKMSLDLRLGRDTLEERVQQRTLALDRLNQQLEQDIVKRKLAEEQIKKALAEKEVLLKEVHHRVKNNLTVISSLLELQAHASQDERIKSAFRNSQQRIQAMTAIHEQLYRSDNLAQIDMAKYIAGLAEDLRSAYALSEVAIQVDIQDIHLSIDQAIPCGLMLNELLTNALKYAFPAGSDRSGQEQVITIGMREENQKIILQVSDNGAGIPEGFDMRSARSLGLKLVNRLTGQLQGDLDVASAAGRGTNYTITFPVQV
jgi:two-component sensor histidine kinase